MSGLRVRIFWLAFAPGLLASAILMALFSRYSDSNLPWLVPTAASVSVLLCGGFALWLARAIADPIIELTRVSEALGAGQLAARTRSHRRDEIGFLGRALDQIAEQLSSRVQAVRAEEGRLRTVLDAMVEAVFVTDPDGIIVISNAALAQMVGSKSEGRTVAEVIRAPELLRAVQAALKGHGIHTDVQLPTNGGTRHFAVQTSALPEQLGAVGILHDITDLKRVEQIRRDFVANASHELRTPLTAIRGFAETLRDGAGEDAATRNRFLDTILEHARRLQRLTDDLLELSRQESRVEQMALTPVDLRAAVERAVRGLDPQAKERDVTVQVEIPAEPISILANERSLDQVLVNLIENAIKYSWRDSFVRIRVHEGGGRPTLEVSDQGPGISAKHLPRIFERFYRADPGRAREVGGTGLGLAIVKHLVERMGADISVESRVGKGSTFRVRFARAEA